MGPYAFKAKLDTGDFQFEHLLKDIQTLNEEAIANLGYMQMKKTHDAAIVLIERLYGGPPRYTYYLGTSQGGREALTVAREQVRGDGRRELPDADERALAQKLLADELRRMAESAYADGTEPLDEVTEPARRGRRPAKRATWRAARARAPGGRARPCSTRRGPRARR